MHAIGHGLGHTYMYSAGQHRAGSVRGPAGDVRVMGEEQGGMSQKTLRGWGSPGGCEMHAIGHGLGHTYICSAGQHRAESVRDSVRDVRVMGEG
jgi:hypothetical protein